MEPVINCSDLLAQLGDDELLVVDVRSQEEWNAFGVHIPGALRMSVEEISEFGQALPDDELIVLCGTRHDGGEVRRAYRLLQFRGRRSVVLAGGLRRWVEEGYPTERHVRRGAVALELLNGGQGSART